jgi:protoheme IX farnesyltransferase
LSGSLFLAISGSTILNMWYDRDIDAMMIRTCWRPLPSGKISPREALTFGLIISLLGIIWSFQLDSLYGIVVSSGLFFDVVVYTIWLKRRTAWSFLWGGISGALPVLAGRVLGYGSIDWIGVSLAAAVLFWIPTHILTFTMRNYEDYNFANIPTFPSNFGFKLTRVTIGLSSILASISMGISMIGISMSWGYLRVILILTIGFTGIVFYSLIKPSDKMNFSIFKYASFFMLGSMIMIVISGI